MKKPDKIAAGFENGPLSAEHVDNLSRQYHFHSTMPLQFFLPTPPRISSAARVTISVFFRAQRQMTFSQVKSANHQSTCLEEL
jgi:hypothetical protein